MLAALPVVATAAISMVVLGVLFSLGLMAAARAFRTNQDSRLESALGALPGVNCGACGHAGCRGYAEAICGGAKVNLCLPGGAAVAAVLADLMGVELGETIKRRAVLHCLGGRSRCGDRFRYVGEADCLAAHLTSGGPKACVYGCLGLGSCARACPFGAITMSDEGLAVINAARCTACGICVRTCPRDLISVLDAEYTIYVGCSSHDKGKAVKDVCTVGCIACGLCEKRDPNGAIKLDKNLPVLDYEKAGGDFAVAAGVCPVKCFVVEGAARAEPEFAAVAQGERS